MVKPAVVEATADCVLKEMIQAGYGEHNLVVYPDMTVLTEIYSRYFKASLENKSEFILFLSTYQNVTKVKDLLGGVDLDAAKYEENGSLVILDSVRGYFGSESDVLALMKILSKRAQNQGSLGSCVFADMGLFNLFKEQEDLLRYEISMPPKFDGYISIPILCKTFCLYHKSDFSRLEEKEREILFEHHYRNLIIRENDVKNQLLSITI
ncbi:MAG TPA: MEDS domain-containing protein [Nitrososphaeraceae archaeon]